MGALGLRDLQIRFRLACMDYIGEFHSILNKEDRDVIANNIPVSFIGIKFHSKPSNIADCVGATTAS